MPFYFKIHDPSIKRPPSDGIVVYSHNEHLESYIEILKEIKLANPDLINECGNPPLMTGKISNWVGYASEPTKVFDSSGNEVLKSYNSQISEIMLNAIEKSVMHWININAQRKITVGNEVMTFEKYINKQGILNDYKVIINLMMSYLDKSFPKMVEEEFYKLINNTTIDKNCICFDINVIKQMQPSMNLSSLSKPL